MTAPAQSKAEIFTEHHPYLLAQVESRFGFQQLLADLKAKFTFGRVISDYGQD